jgi:hypothetical protein
MACEEAEMFYRWKLLEQIAKGEMPNGMTEADLRAMEMPVPGEIELIEEPDGRVIIRKVEQPTNPAPSKRAVQPAAFVCDSPDGE